MKKSEMAQKARKSAKKIRKMQFWPFYALNAFKRPQKCHFDPRRPFISKFTNFAHFCGISRRSFLRSVFSRKFSDRAEVKILDAF